MKSFLNTRQFEILSELLRDDTSKTVEDISNSLNIKPRVVQYNLNPIDGWLKSNNSRIIRRPGFGLKIDLSGTSREELISHLSNLENVELIFDTHQRRRYILIQMLMLSKPISSSRLAEDYRVSRTTILTDLLEIQPLLKQNQLDLVKIPHRGFFIRGNKSQKRYMISVLFCDEHLEDKRSLNDIDKLVYSVKPFDYLSIDQFIQEDIQFSFALILKIEEQLSGLFSHSTKIFLFYYLLFLLSDVRKHQQITDKYIKEIIFFKENALFSLINEEIKAYIHEKISDSEIQIFLLHIHCQTRFDESGSQNINISDLSVNDSLKDISLEIDEDVIKEISLFINPYLQVDKKYFVELTTYLNNCYIYQKYDYSIFNPNSERIKKTFPDTFNIVERISLNYIKYVRLNESDIAQLTLITISALDRIQEIVQREIKVALISITDHTFTHYTKKRISASFPWFKLVGAYRQSDVKKEQLKDVDLILSMVEQNFDCDAKIILIDPFFSELDVQHIQSWINENSIQNDINFNKRQNVRLSGLFSEKDIFFKDKVSDWEEAVMVAGKPLVERGDLTDHYLEAIIKVNKTYGPYSVVAPGIALLHAKSTDGVNNLCIGLMLLKNGVNFNAKAYDPVNIVFIIGLSDSHSHLSALQDLINIIRSKGFTESILMSSTASEALGIVLQHANKPDDVIKPQTQR